MRGDPDFMTAEQLREHIEPLRNLAEFRFVVGLFIGAGVGIAIAGLIVAAKIFSGGAP